MAEAQEPPGRYLYWAGGALLALSFVIRVLSYPVVTSDYVYFLSKWLFELQSHPGLSAFVTPFSDYAPLYLYFLKVLTFIPIPWIYSIKTLSVVCEVMAAFVAYRIIKETSPITYSKPQLFFALSLLLATPTLILNSSLWGQSDALYALGVVLSLYFMLVDKPLPAVLSFAFAFAVKLQAIFFLPVLLGYCLRSERSAGYLILVPLLYIVSIIPARLGGGSLYDLLLVYVKVTGEYTALSVSAQNVFVLLGRYQFEPAYQQPLFMAGLVLAALCAAGIAAFVYVKKRLSARGLVSVALLCVMLIPYFLPRMHERYFYLADILALIYAYFDPKRWYVPVLVIGASLLAYMPYLSQEPIFSSVHVDLRIPSLMMLAAILIVLWRWRFISSSPASGTS